MREILFRGQKTSTKEWIYGSLIINKSGNHTITQVIENPVHLGTLSGWCFGVIPETVGQWIGNNDSTGTKVFEGDILEARDGIEICNTVIYWDEELCGFFDRRDLDGNSFTHFEGDMLWVKQRKIIGNIHETI